MTSTFLAIDEAWSPDLLVRARAGDADAFCQLCEPYEGRLLRQALSLCGDAVAAEELAQETLVEAWKHLARYNGRCRYFTWLCAILLNRQRHSWRVKRPVPISTLAGAEREQVRISLDRLADPTSPPDMVAEETERARLIHSSMQRLPRKHREIIHLRFFVDDSLEGIAAALGCSV